MRYGRAIINVLSGKTTFKNNLQFWEKLLVHLVNAKPFKSYTDNGLITYNYIIVYN